MPIVFAIILGIVQGVTEFLPVSSSGHLVVFQEFLQGIFFEQQASLLTFDVLVHLATLVVVVCFLGADLRFLLQHFAGRSADSTKARALILRLIIGTLPAVVVVLFFKDFIEQSFSSVSTAACGFLVTSCFLEFAHRRQLKTSLEQSSLQTALSWPMPTCFQALIIGCAQALAILPGISRSGSTISAALLFGLPPQTALRFSFLLFVPAVCGASVLELGHLRHLARGDLLAYGVGFLVTCVVGWISLRLLVKVVSGARLRYFAFYTGVLGSGLLAGVWL